MTGYRRFVAYVYEYRRGRKEENCGYVRVEARDDSCSMEIHLKCPGLPGQVMGEIYGFVRHKDGMEGYLLQQCRTLQDGLECSFETETDRLGENPVTLSDLGGMVIRTEGGAFFGTEWDDSPILPDAFFIYEEKHADTPNGAKASAADEERDSHTDQESLSQEADSGVEASSDVEEHFETEVSVIAEAHTEAETASGAEMPLETEVTVPDEEHSEPENGSGKEEFSENQELEAAEHPETESVDDLAANEKIIELREHSDHRPELSVRRESPVLNRDQILQAQQCAKSFDPFPDGSICACRKIHAEDFYRLHPRDRGLRNNRFVAFSYQQFGFLMVGQLTDGRYILGLPGGYDRQERFMAGTFGFPYFKESPEIELPRARGGFWYRLINAPNFDD